MGLVLWLGRALQGLRGWGKSPAQQSGGRWPRQMRQPEEASKARELARSASGFMLGMALASLYGALVLLAQGHNVWYCLVTTTSLGAGLGLGMAFSVKVRVTVLLSLPHIFTSKQLLVPLLEARGVPGGCQIPAEPQDPPVLAGEGKMLLLLLALGMAMQGPCTNILHNFSRAAESLSCGAELALNQTAERLQHAQEPLLNVLSKIKDIAQKAKVVGDHVRKFFRSIMDSVSHVARALRNVWLWLANMGRVCNHELGTPYRRCLHLFDEAKDNCERAIPFLFFLCYVIIIFRPLCGLANVALLFCIIPQYIQSFLKRKIGDPLRDALDRVHREFEFNISAVHRFDISLNASKSLGEVALDIMEGVHLRLEPIRQVLGLFMHVSFCAILYMYLQALRYRHRYLWDDTFDNVYITRRFVELDLWRAEQGKPTVLPLTGWESGRYIAPGQPHARGSIPQVSPAARSRGVPAPHGLTALHARPAGLWLSRQERRRYGLQLVGVLRHVLLGLSIVLADYSLFWLLDLVQHQLRGEIVARAPAVLGVSVNGTGYTSEIFRDLVSAFGVLQQGNISVLSQRCLLQPVEPDYSTYLSMGDWGCCNLSVLGSGGTVKGGSPLCDSSSSHQDSCMASASSSLSSAAMWHACAGQCVPPTTHAASSTILARRAGLARALRQAAMQRTADAGQGNLLLFLTSRLPTFAWLVRLLGIQQKRCLACGMAEQPDFIACITPSCKGLYCSECYQTLTNICSVCMGPLSYRDTGDEEMDSSDEDTVVLWLGAVQALRGQEQGRLLQQHIRKVVGGRGGSRRLPPELAARLRAQLKEEASGESDGGSSGVDGEDSSLSSLDFSYQEQPESSGSELEEVMALQLPSSKGRAR
ncbi:DC-STAMP domain-containing protein 2 isoform X4 [Aquila chrysaetos chrysaetos]|uniref:DC-STAMP domain-containing protein 2 isoform X4 n=1 Tax=Aquila chrysaetos chrysaetos TaxID=223781 RepID=UPI001B7D3DB7|nr:DC-STAMP domain-containing protein 2 isoform X4 [Aquila chrysaetos chrysaetos]